MTAAETLRVALAGIAANTLRSGLTILGMTIGVAAVIVLVAVGNGSQRQVQAGIDALGTNVLIVQAQLGGRGPGGSRAGGGGIELSTKDADALRNTFDAPDVKSAAPVVDVSGTTLVSASTSYSPSSFVGTTPAYAQARDLSAASGELLRAEDVARHRRVVVIGPTIVTNLFDGQDPVGRSLRVDGASFQVIGVTKAKGSNGVQDQDDVVLAPLTAVQDAVSGYGGLSSIVVQATSAASLDAAQAEVTSILSTRHKAADPANPGFQVTNQGAVRAASNQSTRVFTTLLGAVAAISLLVGGIGVMNIMLVSVTERTREIGIRKAIGARRAHILTQFLTEAVLVSLLGGVAGVGLGIAASQFAIAGVAPVTSVQSIVLAFGSALLCGLLFGTYPAARAAALSPIDALRFE